MKTHFESVASAFSRAIRCTSGVAALIWGGGALHAQQDMEGSVPANWSSSNGNTLSISPRHFKMGAGSSRWDWSGGGTLRTAVRARTGAFTGKIRRSDAADG
jgi:hypothetical protein